jgi:hypothetical protein
MKVFAFRNKPHPYGLYRPPNISPVKLNLAVRSRRGKKEEVQPRKTITIGAAGRERRSERAEKRKGGEAFKNRAVKIG